MTSFVHLHVHSEYSLLDGMARLNDLCQYAHDSGMPAVALTDHGQMYGMIKFRRAAEQAGIKPIYGCEVYQAPRRLFQREGQLDSRAHHLILLAKDMTGYRNLLKLVTTANLEGFYYRPRVDRELLAEHAEGLICLSACISGQVPSLIVDGRLDEARRAVGWFKEVYGADNYFIELQRHKGVPDLERVNPQLVALAREFKVRCAATNDVHYVRQKDAQAQELLLAIQTNTTINDDKRMRMGSDDYYLMTPDEMAQWMPEYPEALENTLLVAEQCNVDLKRKGYHLPRFEVPEPYTSETYLRKLCEEGVRRRYSEITPEIRQRLDYELSVIQHMGFNDYFLITWDVVHWAKHEAKMLVGPGRGSGASSIVAYVLGITDLEPLGLDLIFERFLNPSRISMPDIDLDYPEDRRGEVIDYLVRRYGDDKAAQIATFGTMAARTAIRAVGRALDADLATVDTVAKLMPSETKKTIGEGLESVAELKEMYDTRAEVRRLIDSAVPLQGAAQHLSTHAAGVLIADRPLVEYTPLQRAPRGEGVISQYCMEDVEDIGLLKLDILGLSTLTVLDRALKWIEQTTGKRLNPEDIPMDDPDTFALLCSGDVTAVFQVESEGMRRTLRDMQPSEFKDIVAVLALFRPGPMEFIPNYIARKFGREDVVYHDHKLAPILADTYGIIVYQEQIIRIASELAGYSAAEADVMRRAVGKKKKKDIDAQKEKFVAGAIANGVSHEAADAIFDDIEKFANYGFNKSHGAAYAVITLQTAYLKAHYPAEFMAAMLSVERNDLPKVARLIQECRRLGIEVRAPDVNRSGVDFTLERGESHEAVDAPLLGAKSLAIRYGLGAIKNCGDGPASVIVAGRGDQPFASLDDLTRRVDLRQVNRRALECLIRAGVFSELGTRPSLLAGIDQMMAASQSVHRAKEVGQRSLFDLSPQLIDSEGVALKLAMDAPEMPQKERLAAERELLGIYLSSHPLDVLTQYKDDRLTALSDIDPAMEGQQVTVAGVLHSSRVITTKKGDAMAFAQLEDLAATVELVIFPTVYEAARELLSEEIVLLVTANVGVRDGETKLRAESIQAYQVPKEARRRQGPGGKPTRLRIEIPVAHDDRVTTDTASKVYALLAGQRGDTPFCLALCDAECRVEISFPQSTTQYSPQLESAVVALVGREHLQVDWA